MHSKPFKDVPRTRAQERGGKRLNLPKDAAALKWLDAMIVLGPVANGGGPKSWSDILAFSQATGRAEIGPELELLEEMCNAYCIGLDIGNNPLGREPATVEGAKIERGC